MHLTAKAVITGSFGKTDIFRNLYRSQYSTIFHQ